MQFVSFEELAKAKRAAFQAAKEREKRERKERLLMPLITIPHALLVHPRPVDRLPVLERAVEDPHVRPRYVLSTLGDWSRKGLLWIGLPLGVYLDNRILIGTTVVAWGLHGLAKCWSQIVHRIPPGARALSMTEHGSFTRADILLATDREPPAGGG